MCNPEPRNGLDLPPIYPQKDVTREYEKARQASEAARLQKEIERMLQVSKSNTVINIDLKEDETELKVQDLKPGIYQRGDTILIVDKSHGPLAYIDQEGSLLRYWISITSINTVTRRMYGFFISRNSQDTYKLIADKIDISIPKNTITNVRSVVN